MNEWRQESCAVAVIGGGTAGLSLATELRRLNAGSVVVLERESQAGGIPRHCGHYPFGLREYKMLMKGPEYAKRNLDHALRSGADIRTNSSVTALGPDGLLEVSANEENYLLKADRVVICTGVREASRAQRFVGGDRPRGVISTGALQSMVYLKGLRPFDHPIIFGSELVSFSAIQTCAHLGIKPVAMVEEEERVLVRRFFQPYLRLSGVPLFTGVRGPRIVGKDGVEGLEFTTARGERHQIEADGIIVSGRFRPESALLRASHLEVDNGSGGPVVDQFGRCSDAAYFCTGNALRPAETSGFCWQEGVETARRVAEDLKHGKSRAERTIPLLATDPAIAFVVPQRLRLTDEGGAMNSIYLGLNRPIDGRVRVASSDQQHWAGRLNTRPVRRIQIPSPSLDLADPPAEIAISIER